MADRNNLLRVLISTDNHLGVWEKDEIRKDDSFVAFEEVLMKATELGVDFVLLGGDLFHDNKPSRTTVVKAIQIIKKYSFNSKAVSFQILSDQGSNFVSGLANYLDPNLNVGLPIFTIHGNHDDPSGADSLSAVDVLSSCGLINYFGKHLITGSSIGRITISPILMQKGDTRVALYGLGAVRDERLGRLFQTPGMVSWLRPENTPNVGIDDWLSIMVLHQNRVAHGGAQSKSYIQESYLPRFLDLVVWGHEHECRADPEDIQNPSAKVESSGRASAIVVQPGSSVATSLSQGESVRKHCVLLEVMGSQFRTIKYPLETVRPFVYKNIALKDGGASVKPEDPDSVTSFLEEKVTAMIEQANREYPTLPGALPRLPLIRLKVDYSGFSTINAQRFGQSYVNKVANPQDMLTWAKAQAQRKLKAEAEGRDVDDETELLRPEALDQARIEDLVAQNLQQDLQVLQEEDLAIALHDFVEKDDRLALAEVLNRTLLETQQSAMRDPRGEQMEDGEEEIAKLVGACVQQWKAEKASKPRTAAADRELDAIGNPVAGPSSTPAGGSRGMDDIEDEDENAGGGGGFSGRAATLPRAAAPSSSRRGAAKGTVKEGSAAKPPAGRSRAGSAAARGGSKATPVRQSSLFEAFQRGSASQGTTTTAAAAAVESKMEAPPQSPAPAGARSRIETQTSTRPGGTPGSARGKRPSYAEVDDDDDIIIDDDDHVPQASGRRPAGGAGDAAGGSRKGAAKKQRVLKSEDEVEEGDEDYGNGRRGGADSEEIDDDSDGPTRGRKRPGGGAAGQRQPLKPSHVVNNGGSGSARKRTSPAVTPARGGMASSTARAVAATGEDELTIASSDEDNQAATKRHTTLATTAPSANASMNAGAAAGGRKLPSSMMSMAPSQASKGKKNWGSTRR